MNFFTDNYPQIKIRSLLLLFSFFLYSISISAQEITVCGYVTELHTGEKLIYANVVETTSGKGTSTNNYGFFSLRLPKGILNLTASYVGYSLQTVSFRLQKDTSLTIQLLGGVELETVTVQSSAQMVTNIPVSRFELPINEIKQIPVLLGEADVFKAIQMMPGIQAGMEGSAGIFVRGGNAGDNQTLIDGVPVYNPNHLYGFFSVFNTDAVKNVSVYKGAFPARYSGGTASVIDVRIKEGSLRDYSIDGSIGLISSKVMMEGPIIKDKTSFLISGRRTYIDAFTKPLKSSGIMDSNFPSYYFYDINAKINHKISERSRLYFSFYNGNDHILDDSKKEDFKSGMETFSSATTEKSGWGNTALSLRYNQRLSGSLFANATLAYSRYNNVVNDSYGSVTHKIVEDETFKANYLLDYQSKITDAIGKLDFDWYLNDHTIRFGANASQRTINAGDTHYQTNDDAIKSKSDTSYYLPKVTGIEMNMYAEDEFHLFTATINAGMNLSMFQSTGKTYRMLQPRISAVIPLLKNVSLKAGFSEMAQYLHLISETNVRMASDAWVSASKEIEPLKATQVDVGISWQMTSSVGVTAEAYFKKLTQVLGLINGESLYLASGPLNELLEAGKGTAKGLELQINKSEGATTGWINYALAFADRSFPTINQGVTYPFKYDRRHAINVVINHSINKKVSVNIAWLFGTGYPQTLPILRYIQAVPMWDSKGEANNEIEYFNSLNNHRLPVYHRMDVGVTINKQRGRYRRSWNFGLYNAYMRNNPIYQYYGGYRFRSLQSVSLLPIIPYATYNFSF